MREESYWSLDLYVMPGWGAGWVVGRRVAAAMLPERPQPGRESREETEK